MASPKTVKGFTFKEHIGQGGFGSVYLAEQPAVGREVAIKVILSEFANQPDFIRRFEAEAQLVARLEHPHIVPLYDYWREPNGTYLVMRLLRGGSLRDLIKSGSLDPSRALRICEQIGSALAFAHQNRVIHGDLKPANILMDKDLNAYLSDFGIAKDLNHLPSTDSQRKMDQLIGSAGYVAPEQLNGQLTYLSDIYVFGIIIFEMLAGRHPYQTHHLSALFLSHMQEPLPSLQKYRPELPLALDAILAKATAKKPEERYPNVLEMLQELVGVLTGRRSTGVYKPVSVEGEEAEALLNPYKGLRSFSSADAEDFFGREQLVQSLLNRLSQSEQWRRFLALVGPSGSGKSSVVRAGLIPAIRQGRLPGSNRWFVAEMLPGSQALEELAAALNSVALEDHPNLLQLLQQDERGLVAAFRQILPDQEQALVLFIDQFEEIFTQQASEGGANHFLDLLYTALNEPDLPLYLLIALRADFYDRPLAHIHFSQLMRQRTEIVTPLDVDELEAAITAPAQKVGVKIEPALVSSIIGEVSNQPGALPMLQYALTELFDRRGGSTSLNLDDYRSIGGVTGALARRADEVYQALNERQQALAAQVFMRLVTLGEGTEDMRRRVKLSELIALAPGQIQVVVELFGKYRLLSFDHEPESREPTVEVAHEALIRSWGQLQTWLNDGRNDIRLQRLLAAGAIEWDQVGRDHGYLLSGSRLTQFEDWATASQVMLTQAEQDFLSQSIAARGQEQEREKARQERELELAQEAIAAEKRRAAQLRWFVRLLGSGAVILLAVAGLAVWLGIQAGRSEDEANRRAQIAQALALAAQADLENRGNFPERAPLLALAALQEYPYTWQAERALTQSVLNYRQSAIFNAATPLYSAHFHPNQAQMILAEQSGQVSLWDVEGGVSLHSWQTSERPLNLARFSPDGRLALTLGLDGVARLWEVDSQTLLQEIRHQSILYGGDFSPDGQTLATVSNEGNLKVWRVSDGQILWDFSDPRLRSAQSLDFSPDGRLVMTNSLNLIYLWQVETQSLYRRLSYEQSDVVMAAFSPEGERIVAANADNSLNIWSIERGEILVTLNGHSDQVNTAAFSPNGQYVVSGSDDYTGRVWDARTGAELYRLLGHTQSLHSVEFSPDGALILTASLDGSARLWRAQVGSQGQVLGRHTQNATGVAFSPDGQFLATGSLDRRLKLWNITSGELLLDLDQEAWVTELAYSPQGDYILTSTRDGLVFLWDAQTGDLRFTYDKHGSIVDAAAISPDGRWIATGSADRSVHIWAADTGETALIFREHTAAISSLDFSADGSHVISGGFDSRVLLWERETGQVRLNLSGHSGGVTDVSHGGAYLASSGIDATVRLWDAGDGRLLYTFLGHTAPVNTVEFNPQGTRLASGSDDGSVIIWDVASRQNLLSFSAESFDINALSFDSAGRQVAAASDDGLVRLWPVWPDVDALISYAQNCCIFRALGPEERQLFGLSD
jgi:WD40 repeat protein/serine/threonine protein kinase